MRTRALLFFLVFSLIFSMDPAEAARKKRRARAKGPLPTHPVILWSKTLNESKDLEERRVAAYKLSQYSQPIFQDPVVNTLTECVKDADLRIRVLCTKALGNANQQKHSAAVQKALLERFEKDAALKSTVARALKARDDESPAAQAALLKELETSTNEEDLTAILDYFEKVGDGSAGFVKTLIGLYKRMGSAKIRRNTVKALSERAQGQDSVVELLSQCAQDGHTPLALICLSGLQQQAKTDPRAWKAVEGTIQSDDPDVLIASLDVIQALPESANPRISSRLVELIDDSDDADLQEKALLALGVCGDQSPPVEKTLLKTLGKTDNAEGIRIAAALVLPKQAKVAVESAKEALESCSKETSSKGLRTACQLSKNELEKKGT